MNDTQDIQPFLIRHLALVVGVCLPLLLVVVFWLAMAIPRWTVAPPGYDLVLVSRSYVPEARQLPGNLSFVVKDGILTALFVSIPAQLREGALAPPRAIPVPELYYFDSVAGSLREIDFAIPDNLADGDTFVVTELADRMLLDDITAPDGYIYYNNYRGSRGFLFFIGGYRYNAKIEKDGNAIKVPTVRNNYPGSYEFLGWTARESSR